MIVITAGCCLGTCMNILTFQKIDKLKFMTIKLGLRGSLTSIVNILAILISKCLNIPILVDMVDIALLSGMLSS